MPNLNEKRSIAAKKAWRRRKEMDRARGRILRRDQIVAASVAEKSSAVIAKEFGVSASYVRTCWAKAKMEPRSKAHPEQTAGPANANG